MRCMQSVIRLFVCDAASMRRPICGFAVAVRFVCVCVCAFEYVCASVWEAIWPKHIKVVEFGDVALALKHSSCVVVVAVVGTTLDHVSNAYIHNYICSYADRCADAPDEKSEGGCTGEGFRKEEMPRDAHSSGNATLQHLWFMCAHVLHKHTHTHTGHFHTKVINYGIIAGWMQHYRLHKMHWHTQNRHKVGWVLYRIRPWECGMERFTGSPTAQFG